MFAQASNFECVPLDETKCAFLLIKSNNMTTLFDKSTIIHTTSLRHEPILQKPAQTAEQRNKLLQTYSADKLFVVCQHYIAFEKLCQLDQNVGDLIGVIKPFDPSNQKHIWFVDNGLKQGFIPMSALAPYSPNLIELNGRATAEAAAVAAAAAAAATSAVMSTTRSSSEQKECPLTGDLLGVDFDWLSVNDNAKKEEVIK